MTEVLLPFACEVRLDAGIHSSRWGAKTGVVLFRKLAPTSKFAWT